jgi:hypothetical protein
MVTVTTCVLVCVHLLGGSRHVLITHRHTDHGRVRYLKLVASEQAVPRPADAPASSCPADACTVRVRNAAEAEAGESEGRFRVIVRALIFGLNDWRTTLMPLEGVLKDVRRQRRA